MPKKTETTSAEYALGYAFGKSEGATNTARKAVGEMYQSDKQQVAQYFADRHTAEANADYISGYASAKADAGIKPSTIANAVSAMRVLADANQGALLDGIAEKPILLAFEHGDDGTVLGFAVGGWKQEVTRCREAQRTAIERVALLDGQKRAMIAAHSDALAEFDRRRNELMALVK